MKLICTEYNTLDDSTKNYVVEISDYSQGFLKSVGLEDNSNLVLNEKFYPGYNQQLLNQTLPYILHDGKILFEVSYRDITIGDFIATFPGVVDSGIAFDICVPAAGGYGWIVGETAVSLTTGLLQSFSIVDPITGTLISTMGLSIIEIIKSICEKRGANPQEIIDSINHYYNMYSYVTVREMSEALDLDEYHTRELLKGIGYKIKDNGYLYLSDINREKVLSLVAKIKERERKKMME